MKSDTSEAKIKTTNFFTYVYIETETKIFIIYKTTLILKLLTDVVLL